MQRLEVSCALRRIYTSLGAKGLMDKHIVFLVRYEVFYMLCRSILVFKIFMYLKCLFFFFFAIQTFVLIDDDGYLNDSHVNLIQSLILYH
jgi:hypothetical protein